MRQRAKIVILSAFIHLFLADGCLAAPEAAPSAISDTAAAQTGLLNTPEQTTEAKYMGNVDSMKFHLSECEFAKVMDRKRKIKFQDFRQAVEAGMKPCNWCLPRYQLHVEGKLLYSRF